MKFTEALGFCFVGWCDVAIYIDIYACRDNYDSCTGTAGKLNKLAS